MRLSQWIGMQRMGLAITLMFGCGLSRGEGASPMSFEVAAKVASRAIDTASALADMLDVGKSDLGEDASMEKALAHARELAPKPLDGMDTWSAGPFGTVRARVSEPMLCRTLMDQCRSKSRSVPTACACQPDGVGEFMFSLRIMTVVEVPVEPS